MNATIARRVLFALAPVEVLFVGLMLAGVELPTTARWLVIGLFVAALIAELIVWTGAFWRFRAKLPLRPALARATEQVLGQRLWAVASSEFALAGSLVRMCLGRPSVPEGSRPFSNHRRSEPIRWLLVGITVVEIVVLHLVIPWPTARLVLVILSAYSLLWVVGLIAGFNTHPHLLVPDAVILRHGPRTRLQVPRRAIASVRVREADLPGVRSIKFEHADPPGGDPVLHLAQAGRTNTVLTLAPAIDGGALSGGQDITRIHCWLDDPKAFCASLDPHPHPHPRPC